ncbi:FHA domain-containing protein [Actinotalea sp. Marseille-Q4924]|uniref:FHA domain-containing protein n=1 Tax=Actinotalea sp. Marseille-Q4924 TaxID=2866571 RepID=UPI001CE3B86E|nr:FHA domain-containing protein [Actinotalea sp. Marseille-Q4924]
MPRGTVTCAACSATVAAAGEVCPRCGLRHTPSPDGSDRLDLPLLLAGAVPATTAARAAAVVVDVLIGLLLLGAAAVLLAAAGAPPAAVAVGGVAVVAVHAAAVWAVQARTGRTAGKLALGLRAVDRFTGLPPGRRGAPVDRWASVTVLDVRAGRDPTATVAEPTLQRLARVAEGGFAPPRTAAAPVPAQVAAPAPRPSAPPAVIVLDDGQRVEVRSVALLGRRPQPRPDEEVEVLVSMDDFARSVSKTHARLRWDGQVGWVVDRGSTNGTAVEHATGRRTVGQDVEEQVLPGQQVHLGRRSFVLEVASPVSGGPA